jgi:hypothetical protein
MRWKERFDEKFDDDRSDYLVSPPRCSLPDLRPRVLARAEALVESETQGRGKGVAGKEVAEAGAWRTVGVGTLRGDVLLVE